MLRGNAARARWNDPAGPPLALALCAGVLALWPQEDGLAWALAGVCAGYSVSGST